MSHQTSGKLSKKASTAVMRAFETVDPVGYLRQVATSAPAVFCELLGTVLADDVAGALVLEEALAAMEGIP